MSPKFFLSENYMQALEETEDFVFESSGSISAVENFLKAHDSALKFVAQKPSTPAVHSQTGDQSWIFGDGRYRIFFKVVTQDKEMIIYLTHIIDNRRANLDIYFGNSLPTYEID